MAKKTTDTKHHLQLYGRPIFTPEEGLTLTSQVREILLEEIHNGHWQVGERLPSVAQLARQSGLSRWPIQEAFECLRKEGYLRQTERSGTFLESLTPKGSKPLGLIGVAMLLDESPGNWKTVPHTQYRLAQVIKIVESRNFAVEVKYLRPEDDWSDVDRIGAVFSEATCGVISLAPFPHPAPAELAPDRLPFVYLGGNNHECRPTVAGDTMNGFYMMTRLVIEKGHRNIICFGDPNDTEYEQRDRLIGHERAMREAGLEVNLDAFRRSLGIAEGDLSALRRFLEDFRDATAIICMWGGADFHIVEVAGMMGIRVPDDLSITGHGAGPMGAKPDSTMTCLEYDQESLVNSCIDLVLAQKARRRADVSLVLGNPRIHMGDSLVAPRRSAAPAAARLD